MAECANERREHPRLNLRLNVEFMREGEERQASGIGTTLNICSGGACFATAEWEGLEVGQRLGVRFSGLSGYGSGPLFRSIRAQATIVRVNPPEDENMPYAKAEIAAQFSDRPCSEVYRWLE